MLISHAFSLPSLLTAYTLCDFFLNLLHAQGEVFFINKDCILEDYTLVEPLYVHVGVWYVFGPNLSQLPPSLARPPVCHYFFPLSLASRAHPLGMWDATFKLVFFNLLARLDFSWTLLIHITHTQAYSHTRVFAPPNLLVRCHLSLMALFLFAFSAYVQHRARGLVTARRVRGTPRTSIPTGTGARWTIPGVPPLKPIYGHLTCGICRLQVVIHPSYT